MNKIKIAVRVLVWGVVGFLVFGTVWISLLPKFEARQSAALKENRPSAKDIESAVKRYSQQLHFAGGVLIESSEYGVPLVSKGGYGPEGTEVIPVRVTYFLGSVRRFTEDVYFWKDPFGTWSYKVDESRVIR